MVALTSARVAELSDSGEEQQAVPVAPKAKPSPKAKNASGKAKTKASPKAKNASGKAKVKASPKAKSAGGKAEEKGTEAESDPVPPALPEASDPTPPAQSSPMKRPASAFKRPASKKQASNEKEAEIVNDGGEAAAVTSKPKRYRAEDFGLPKTTYLKICGKTYYNTRYPSKGCVSVRCNETKKVHWTASRQQET